MAKANLRDTGFVHSTCFWYHKALKERKDVFLKPIFNQKLGSRWLPNANEIYTKNMKCTWPTRKFCVGYPLHLYSTDWRRGLALGVTQILGLASEIGVGGNTKIYQHVGISHAKFWRWVHCPTPTPDARYFALQWNIGLRLWGYGYGRREDIVLLDFCVIQMGMAESIVCRTCGIINKEQQ